MKKLPDNIPDGGTRCVAIIIAGSILFWLWAASAAFGADNLFTGATNSNWGTSTNWSQGTVPTSNDTHVTRFDATSPNCTVNTSNRVCNAINFTGYTNTITMTFAITSSGDTTLGSAMLVSGSGNLNVNATGTLTANGFIWPNGLTLTGTTPTLTFADSWTVTGLLSVGNAANVFTLNGSSINAKGGFRFTGTSGTITGTTTIILAATQTVDAPSVTSGRILVPVTINAPGGTITFTSPVYLDVGKLNYVAGTVVTNATWASGGGAVIVSDDE